MIGEPQRILLIRLRQIGDVVFTTPAVRALRGRCPSARISYLVEPPAEPVVRLNPHLDEVIVAPRSAGVWGLRAELALVRRLRRARFDLVIDFHGGPRASILAWLSGAPTRIGYRVRGRSWMYTHQIPRTRALTARHSVENQWDLLSPLGVPPPGVGREPVEMPVDPRAIQAVERRLAAAGVVPDDRIIVLHVSAGNPFRRWPLASFAAVATALAHDDARHRVAVTSGPADRDAAARVIATAQAALPAAARERVLACGDFSLTELRALVDRAALYVGGDSGPLHLAATSRVPIVALYGPTLAARSAPWRVPAATEAVQIDGLGCRPCDQRRCAPGDFRCLAWITPEQVLGAAGRLLARPTLV